MKHDLNRIQCKSGLWRAVCRKRVLFKKVKDYAKELFQSPCKKNSVESFYGCLLLQPSLSFSVKIL